MFVMLHFTKNKDVCFSVKAVEIKWCDMKTVYLLCVLVIFTLQMRINLVL